MKTPLLFILTIAFQISSFAQGGIEGKYKNNVAANGFFGEKLTLKEDSTFNYSTGGDLSHQYGNGTYNIKNNRLFLYFNKVDYGDLDSLILSGKITSCAYDSLSNKYLDLENPDLERFEIISRFEIVDIEDIKVDSMIFRIQRFKLFVLSKNGKVIRKVHALSKLKKYILWGEPYMKKRRYYLIKE